MSQQQQDYYKQILGDANASVTVSREVSEGQFGNGGKAFVSVTLRCDQSQQMLPYAIDLAKSLAEAKVWEHHSELKNQLITRGILK